MTIAVSVFCSVYLHGQFIEINEYEQEFVGAMGNSTSSDSFIFPEVEVVKVFVEKIIDIVTISRL